MNEIKEILTDNEIKLIDSWLSFQKLKTLGNYLKGKGYEVEEDEKNKTIKISNEKRTGRLYVTENNDYGYEGDPILRKDIFLNLSKK